MKLRNRIISTLALVGSLGSSVVLADDELKLAHFMSTKHPFHAETFVNFSESVSALSNGKLKVRIYPSGELGAGPVKQFDRVTSGVTDIAFGLPGYTASKFPLTLLLEMPGAVTKNQDRIARTWENIELLNKEYKRVKLLALWTSIESVLFSREKPIRSMEDLAGMKVRVPSRNAGKLVSAWGATPVSMPITQVYSAMQTGVVDAVLVDPTGITSFKLGEVSKYITTGMNAPTTPFYILMNRDSWKELSKEEQSWIEMSAGELLSHQARDVQAHGAGESTASYLATGKEIIGLSTEEADKFNHASAKVLEQMIVDLEKKGKKAREFVTALQGE